VSSLIGFFENIFKPKPKLKVSYTNYKSDTYKTTEPPAKPKDEITQEKIDEILDKLKVSGYASLSKEEKNILFEYSKK
jgi:hypothetical protein